jgi:prepilin-type N-terminal cleavage/methylation domain-containing protein
MQFSQPQHLATSERGFTLLEVMVVTAISVIVGSIAMLKLPSMNAVFDRMRARTLVLQDMKRAQAEAITWGCRGVVSIPVGGTSYSYGCDFLAYDTNNPPAADKVFFVRKMPSGLTISTSSNIIFSSRGQAVDIENDVNNVTVTLTDDSSGYDTTYMQGTLLGTGAFSWQQ